METPSELWCPLTKTIMQDPVLTICGHAFDRPAIEEWFAIKDCCPRCLRVLSLKELRPAQLVLNQLTTFQLENLCGVLPGSSPWLGFLGALVSRELQRCEMQDMRVFLEDNSLGLHFDSLVRNGFLTLTALARFREADCLRIGLDKVQRAPLLEAVAELVATTFSLSASSASQSTGQDSRSRRLSDRLNLDLLRNAVESKCDEISSESKERERSPSRLKSDESSRDAESQENESPMTDVHKSAFGEEVVTLHAQQSESTCMDLSLNRNRNDSSSNISIHNSTDNVSSGNKSSTSSCSRNASHNKHNSSSVLSADVQTSHPAFSQRHNTPSSFSVVNTFSSRVTGSNFSDVAQLSSTKNSFPVTASLLSNGAAASCSPLVLTNSSTQTRSTTGISSFLLDGVKDNTGSSGDSGSTGHSTLWSLTNRKC